MAATTATWAIPYPQGTDRFCDGWLFTQEMAERVDAILDGFDTDLTFVESPPAARVTLTTNEVVDPLGSGGSITFDQVDFDTDSWVNLSANPLAIETTGSRYILTGVTAGIVEPGAAGDQYQLLLASSNSFSLELDSRDSAVNAWESVSGMSKAPLNVQATALHFTAVAGALNVLASARMYAIWTGNQ